MLAGGQKNDQRLPATTTSKNSFKLTIIFEANRRLDLHDPACH
jgi:hypothetical protein